MYRVRPGSLVKGADIETNSVQSEEHPWNRKGALPTVKNPLWIENRHDVSPFSRSASETSSLSLASGFRFTQYCEQLAEIAHNGVLEYVQECDTFPKLSLANQDLASEVDLPCTNSGSPSGDGSEEQQEDAVGELSPDVSLGLVDVLQTRGLIPQISPRLRMSPGMKATLFDERPLPLSSRVQSSSPSKYAQNEDANTERAKLEAFRNAFIDAEAA
jgi:hypothetical protein